MMGESITVKKKVPKQMRRYSDSCILDTTDSVHCDRIPPLHDIVTANNEKNEKLNGLSKVDCDNNLLEGEETEDIEDDWFVKLTNSNESWSSRIFSDNGNSSDNVFCASGEPLLEGDDLDFKERTMHTLRVGLRKIWKRGSATITEADPTYKVAYLGNVLTGWAKGEGCIEKPLNTLWKNYSSSSKPDVQMKITVTQSGLKAITKDHGLTEYWSHRITYCSAPTLLPRVFCWVYRHEGRKLKQELRCHAVLCSKESIARRMATTLRLRLAQALLDFKRDKLLRQNARLSLANSVYENPSLPRRKILLSTGSQNYRPPLERSKSAPKLMAIEESLEEEESTPKAKRKFSEGEENMENGVAEKVGNEEEEKTPRKRNADDKCEYKLSNLNFVKKLCSSIENLVEGTSNYGKKLFTERRSSKDFCLAVKKPEESILKKSSIEEEGLEYIRKSKPRKSVTFVDEDKDKKEMELEKVIESEEEEETKPETFSEFTKCIDYKKPEVEEYKNPLEVVLEVKDLEKNFEVKDFECSDEGSNSLQSISSCSSDVSSSLTSSSDKSSEVPVTYKIEDDIKLDAKDYFKGLQIYRASMESFHTYLNSFDDHFLSSCDDKNKVKLHPKGENKEKTDVRLGSVTNIDREEIDSLSGDEGKEQEDDVVSDESGYVELTEHVVKRLSLDSKEKDVPYHQIIKSSMLRPRRIESSCLQV